MYEEAIQTVTTVRDFGQVFDAYAQFEESMISAKMETAAEMGTSEEGVCGCVCVCVYMYMCVCTCTCVMCTCTCVMCGIIPTDDLDLELRLERYETLMDRRPLLLSRWVWSYTCAVVSSGLWPFGMWWLTLFFTRKSGRW